MEIQTFIAETAKGVIPLSTLTTLAADRRAFGDDVLAGFRTQIELRSTAAQTVLTEAEKAGRDSLLASEQRSYDAHLRERDSILSLQRAIEQRTESRNFVPHTQTVKPPAGSDEIPVVLDRETRCFDVMQRRGVPYAHEPGADRLSLGKMIRALAFGDRRGMSDLEVRVMSEGTDSAGGFTVPDIVGAVSSSIACAMPW